MAVVAGHSMCWPCIQLLARPHTGRSAGA